MRRSILLAPILLAACFMAAQSTSGYGTPQSQGSSQSSMGGQDSAEDTETLAGCLSKSGADYFLTRSDGDRYQVFGDTSKLASHVGHKIQITGEVSLMDSSTESSSGSGLGTKPQAGSIKMQSFQHVTARCQ